MGEGVDGAPLAISYARAVEVRLGVVGRGSPGLGEVMGERTVSLLKGLRRGVCLVKNW